MAGVFPATVFIAAAFFAGAFAVGRFAGVTAGSPPVQTATATARAPVGRPAAFLRLGGAAAASDCAFSCS